MNYQEWLNIWLENYVKPAVKIRTYERYSDICNLHIIPSLGDKALQDLTSIELQKFTTQLLKNGNHKTGKELSANFVNIVISVLKNSLKTAYLLGLKSAYEANGIKRP